VFADTQIEYPETVGYVQETCTRYGAELIIARANRTPAEQWAKQGWPMLGKLPARKWAAKNQSRMGFRLDVTGCCRTMKIAPARKAMRQHGTTLQLTGVRGNVDDSLRGMRAIKDTATHYVEADKLTICNPLTGWTDAMIRRYIGQNHLPEHPAKARGALTIGCMFCGGGGQFDNSGFRCLRQTQPDAWREFMTDMGGGEIILAIKYDKPLYIVREAVKQCGGIDKLVDDRPWVFDFLRLTPLRGYSR